MSKETLEQKVQRYRSIRGLKRFGKCKMCGKCCEGLIKLYTPQEDQHTFRQVDTRDIGCPMYDEKNKRCKCHKKVKPEMCILFPYFPENRFKGCGYRFRREL